jgi:phage tail protein X
LLDTAAPPPIAPGWTSREPSGHTAGPALPGRGAIPQSYVVRDGDSLTSLAIRFYGHPGAAAAILEANRDVFTRPDMLPIGISIRLPPPWTVSAVRPAGGPHTIEPGPAVDRGRPAEAGRSPFAPASAPRPWLAPPAT